MEIKFSDTCDVKWYSFVLPKLQKGGFFLCIWGVLRGEESSVWIVLERLWQQQNLKVEANSGLIHENLLLFVWSFPYRWICWFFCQSVTLAKPLSSVWVFWVYPFLLPLAYMWQTILWTVGAPNSAFYSFSLTKTSYFEEERKKCSLGKITFES